MPYLVKQLIEGKPLPITTRLGESIPKALNIMMEKDYSQLPVVNDDEQPLGMVTYEGIMRGIRNFKAPVEDLYVQNVLEPAQLFYLEDDLFDMLEQLKQKNAVLIVDPGNYLVGIVTSYDSTEYFRNRAEHLMHVEDIEATIKEIVLLAYTLDGQEINQLALAEAIASADYPVSKNQKPKTYDELTLGQYISLLVNKQTWGVFEPIFQLPRNSVLNILECVRETRNELAHFRRELKPEHVDQLRFCWNWITRLWESYQNQLELKEKPSTIIQGNRPEGVIREIRADDEITTLKDSKTLTPIGRAEPGIIAEEKKPNDSRYTPLADWLKSQPGKIDQVKLTFEEIEEIINGDLPPSAYTHRVWWANDSVEHPHSILWLEAGWRRSYLNMSEKHVTFVRIIEREKAYIDFFNELVARLREKADIPLRDISPDGQSWILYQYVASPKASSLFYVFSFARGKRFRVELYIDTGEQKTNKRIFDLIQTHQAELETQLGNISWERIDDKRASRIAQYHSGSITDDAETLAKLREWAIDRMIALYNAIEPIASEVALEVMKD